MPANRFLTRVKVKPVALRLSGPSREGIPLSSLVGVRQIDLTVSNWISMFSDIMNDSQREIGSLREPPTAK
jgi:hypothetical protein